MKQVEYYKNGNRTLRIKYEGIKKLLEKKCNEIERLENIIAQFDDFIIELYNHIPYGEESNEFMLIIDRWNEINELNEPKEENTNV